MRPVDRLLILGDYFRDLKDRGVRFGSVGMWVVVVVVLFGDCRVRFLVIDRWSGNGSALGLEEALCGAQLQLFTYQLVRLIDGDLLRLLFERCE